MIMCLQLTFGIILNKYLIESSLLQDNRLTFDIFDIILGKYLNTREYV